MTVPMAEFKIITDSENAVLLKLRVHPGAKRSSFNGFLGDALKVDLQAPPVDGKANAALLKFLAKEFDLSKSSVELKSGETCRDKVVRISGMTPEKIYKILNFEK